MNFDVQSYRLLRASIFMIVTVAVAGCSKNSDMTSPERVTSTYIQSLKDGNYDKTLTVLSERVLSELGSDKEERISKLKQSPFRESAGRIKSFKIIDVSYFDDETWAIVRVESEPNVSPMLYGKDGSGFYIEKKGSGWVYAISPKDEKRLNQWAEVSPVVRTLLSDPDAK